MVRYTQEHGHEVVVKICMSKVIVLVLVKGLYGF